MVLDIVVVATILTAVFLAPTFLKEVVSYFIKPNLKIHQGLSIEKVPRFLKYPGHLQEQTLPNMVYCGTLIENERPSGRFPFLKAGGRASADNIQVGLKATNAEGWTQEQQLLWLLGTNPLTLSFQPGDKFPIHFLTISLEGHEMFIPTTPLGEPGKWLGPLLPPGVYDLYLRPTGGQWASIGRFTLPRDFLAQAHEAVTSTHARENGGYVIYFEKTADGVQINYQGKVDGQRLAKLDRDYKPARIMVNGNPWKSEGS